MKTFFIRSVFFISLLFMTILLSGQDLLDNPQKIVIDEAHDRLLVSNFGDSSLVAIDNEGNQSYFVQDAGFVDGMEIVGNIVYGVGNPRRLIAYDLDSAEQVLDYYFPGSSADYLSSVASDSSGHLFISCPALHIIYKFRLSDQSWWIFAEGNGLNRPNGIFPELENDRIIVIDDSPGTSIIHAVSLADSTVTDLITTDLNNPDGIVRSRTGEYYIGGYYLPGIYRLDSSFSQPPDLVYTGSHMVYPTYDPADHSLLVTHYLADTWERIMLPGGFLFGSIETFPAVDPEDITVNVDNMVFNPDPGGFFTIRLPLGFYDITAGSPGYEVITLSEQEIREDQYTTIYIPLSYLQAPHDLQAELIQNNIYLTWEFDPPDCREFQNFSIHRSINGGEYEVAANTTEQQYHDILQPGDENCYYITSRYEQNNESEPSDTITVCWNDADMENIENIKNAQLHSYPNPFNPVTEISFLLAENADVSLDIYNIKGQKIKTMINTHLSTGEHNTFWDGRNDQNSYVSSGVYFCKLEVSGHNVELIKIVLLD